MHGWGEASGQGVGAHTPDTRLCIRVSGIILYAQANWWRTADPLSEHPVQWLFADHKAV